MQRILSYHNDREARGVKLGVCSILCRTQCPWWRHQMETFPALLAICAVNSPVTGEFARQRPVTHSFGTFFDLRLNKPLSKHSWGWRFETSSRTLWRHCKAGTHFANVFVHRNSNPIENSFSTYPSNCEVTVLKFCPWFDSCTVLACANFCSDMIPDIGVTPKAIFHGIWNTMEK